MSNNELRIAIAASLTAMITATSDSNFDDHCADALDLADAMPTPDLTTTFHDAIILASNIYNQTLA